MRNMGSSDHLPGEPDAKDGFKPSPKQIIGAVIALVLVIFIAVNNKSTEISLVFAKIQAPLWLVLAVTTLVGFGVGMMFGTRRTKAKLNA